MGKGVSACATCDGFFYKGQDVARRREAGTPRPRRRCTSRTFARHVTVIHRRDKFRAEKILQTKLLEKGNVVVRWNAVLDEVLGDAKGVNGIYVKDVSTGTKAEARRARPVRRGGTHAEHRHLRGTARYERADTSSPVVVVRATQARPSVPGVFAAGDVQDYVYRQAVTSSRERLHRGARRREVSGRAALAFRRTPGAPAIIAQTPEQRVSPTRKSPCSATAVRGTNADSPRSARPCDAASLRRPFRSNPCSTGTKRSPRASTPRCPGTHPSNRAGAVVSARRPGPRRSAQAEDRRALVGPRNIGASRLSAIASCPSKQGLDRNGRRRLAAFAGTRAAG